jgi:hypothetical protein
MKKLLAPGFEHLDFLLTIQLHHFFKISKMVFGKATLVLAFHHEGTYFLSLAFQD